MIWNSGPGQIQVRWSIESGSVHHSDSYPNLFLRYSPERPQDADILYINTSAESSHLATYYD